MARPRRVLIVDDSLVVRQLLGKVLAQQPQLAVCATTPNDGALEKIAQLRPDVVVLDLEMPHLNGLKTLRRIRRADLAMPVLMFSTEVAPGSCLALQARSVGADAVVRKPADFRDREGCAASIRETLLPTLLELCENGAAPREESPRPPLESAAPPPAAAAKRAAARPATAPASRVATRRRPFQVIGIGTSTGGPEALAELVPALPADLPVPVLIVIHMPAGFTSLLARRLDALSPLRVVEAQDGMRPEPGGVWIAPGGRHMTVRGGTDGPRIRLEDGPPENSCRPAVDVLFRSLPEVYGRSVLGLVMTGMGHDGLRGSEAIVAGGGRLLVQDEASSVVWGMPGSVCKKGLADRVLPLDQLPGELAWRASATGPLTALTG